MAPTKKDPKEAGLKAMKSMIKLNTAVSVVVSAKKKRAERQKRNQAMKQFNSSFKLEETECEDERAPHRLHDFGKFFEVRVACGVRERREREGVLGEGQFTIASNRIG